MKAALLPLLLGLLLTATGCGTIGALMDVAAVDRPIGWYPGVQIDWRWVEDLPWYFGMLVAIDLPFSLVGDTVALPVYALQNATTDTPAGALVARALDAARPQAERVQAIDDLATVDPPPGPGTGAELLALTGDAPPLREALARILPVLDLPPADLAAALTRLLADDDVEVRRAAVLAWVTSHPRYEAGLPAPLAAALRAAREDPDEDVRDYAAEALPG